MAIATMMERLEALRRTKLYDLLTAAPVIAWFIFSVAQMLLLSCLSGPIRPCYPPLWFFARSRRS